MKKVTHVLILTALLAIPFLSFRVQTAKADKMMHETPPETTPIMVMQETDSDNKGKTFDDNILILMKSEDCTDEQIQAILTKYNLTLINEGKTIPYCTVQLEKSMSEQELVAIADALALEDGILSAMLSYISQLY